MAIIAPFWATTDTYFAFRVDHSKVYYQVYSQTKKSSSEILKMASEDVKRYSEDGEFANFAASWVLVVTWEKLCPYVYYPYYYYYYYYYYGENFPLNCPWVSISFPSFFPFCLISLIVNRICQLCSVPLVNVRGDHLTVSSKSQNVRGESETVSRWPASVSR